MACYTYFFKSRLYIAILKYIEWKEGSVVSFLQTWNKRFVADPKHLEHGLYRVLGICNIYIYIYNTDTILYVCVLCGSIYIYWGPQLRYLHHSKKTHKETLEKISTRQMIGSYHLGNRKKVRKNVLMPSISSCTISASPKRKNALWRFLSCGQREFQAEMEI